jgi:hypothetical protein
MKLRDVQTQLTEEINLLMDARTKKVYKGLVCINGGQDYTWEEKMRIKLKKVKK